MPRTRVGEVEIEFEVDGPPGGRPLLLIMGLGSQMVRWPPAFLGELAARGYRVIRFDNRDVGGSTHLEAAGSPDLPSLLGAAARGEAPPVPYTLEDMAGDAAGLLDALGIGSAHVLGVSMGGAIAQVLAIRHPTRVRSLVSVMSTTGAPDLPPPTPEAMAALLTVPPRDREAFLEHSVHTYRVIAGELFDEALERELAARVFERGIDPAGTARQLAAMITAPSRREALRAVRAPAVVLHGAADPLVPVQHGEDTARHLPAARWMVLPGLGHWFPAFHRPDVMEALVELAAGAEEGGRPD